MNDTPNSKPRHSFRKGFFAAVVFLAIAAAAYFYGFQTLDMVRAASFTPSSQLSGVEERIELTDTGTRIFRATSPAIEDSDQFNSDCQSTERTTAILGCYYRDKIYLYNVQNEELDGALETTAAHELLHAAYSRLNFFEKQRVDALINAQYEKVKDDETIKELMSYYSEAEPGEETNELHSILGTTIASLDSELEEYYARYFEDRAVVVALSQKYTQTFASLEAQAEEYKTKIASEEAALETAISDYKSDLSQLNSDIQSFNQRAQSGDFTSLAAFQSSRSTLAARVSALNQQQAELNSRIEAYNDMIAEYNALAVRANQLYQSINGVTAPSEISDDNG